MSVSLGQSRRLVWGLCLIIVTALIACSPTQTSGQDEAQSEGNEAEALSNKAPFIPSGFEGRPNIIIMLADDLGRADLGFRGSDIETPHIDRLAREGTVLDRFYAMPICTPTRSALMTGRDPMKLGSIYAGFQPWQNGGVSPEEHFMPQSFQAAGYQTAMIGKWHLGHSHELLTPNARGFDYFLGHLNTQIDYFDYTVAKGYDLQKNGQSVVGETRYATDMHGAEAAHYISELRDPDKPFFLYVPFLAPHSPMQAPEALEAKYSHRRNIPTPKRSYAAMVDSLDQAVGRILESLDAEGLSQDTLILFFSDNGGLKAFGADNGPLRGGKLETFEGGIKVAAVLHWPGQVKPGAHTENVISVMDVFPTLSEAANVPMGETKPLDGKSRWSAITQDGDQARAGDLYFASNSPLFNRYHVSVIEEPWKLVQIIDHGSSQTELENFLFNLKTDPYEKDNLAETHPDRVKKMADKIRKWRAQHPINGVRVALTPHPGWRAPLDYAKSVQSAQTINDEAYEGYVSGVRGKILQKRHGDKGRIAYD